MAADGPIPEKRRKDNKTSTGSKRVERRDSVDTNYEACLFIWATARAVRSTS